MPAGFFRCGERLPFFGRLGFVQRDRFADERFERLLVDLFAFVEVDRAPGVALDLRGQIGSA